MSLLSLLLRVSFYYPPPPPQSFTSLRCTYSIRGPQKTREMGRVLRVAELGVLN